MDLLPRGMSAQWREDILIETREDEGDFKDRSKVLGGNVPKVFAAAVKGDAYGESGEATGQNLQSESQR